MVGGWSARARMSGPLVEFVEQFETELIALGYRRSSAASQLRLVADLDAWLSDRGLDASALTAGVVAEFMAGRRAAGMHERSPKALEPLLACLREIGAAPAPAIAAPVTPTDLLLERYRCYLVVERGLTAGTARSYLGIVRPFVEAAHAATPAGLGRLVPGDVTRFLVAESRKRRGKQVVTALRSVLRFLQLEGAVGAELAAAVPSAAGWRLARVPQMLAAGHAALLLDTCDRLTAVGRRDFAILTVLIRLGLRAGEVAALALEDIDWRAGLLSVPNVKRRRRDALPLPVDVGEAVTAYLLDGRPETTLTRAVFVRVQAPLRGLDGSGVCAVVRSAAARAGLGPVGAHRLRHTAASDTLAAGASLAEVGQLLRHRQPRTTAIYAKVRLDALRRVARPWPETVS